MRDACIFPGCGLPQRGRRLCSGHWKQQDRGRELTPLLVAYRERKSPPMSIAAIKKRRYWDLKAKHRCTLCANRLPEKHPFSKCDECLGRMQVIAKGCRIRQSAKLAEPSPPPRSKVPRCPRCWLVLPHEGCLPTSHTYAQKRTAVDVL